MSPYGDRSSSRTDAREASGWPSQVISTGANSWIGYHTRSSGTSTIEPTAKSTSSARSSAMPSAPVTLCSRTSTCGCAVEKALMTSGRM